MLTSMDAYAQYARSRRTRPLGLSNRRLAAMLGDFVYETSSAEDESRRYLEMLHSTGKQVLTGRDLASLERFTSEHNRESVEPSASRRSTSRGAVSTDFRAKSSAPPRRPSFAQNLSSPRTPPRWIGCSPRRTPYAGSGIRLRIELRVMTEGDSTSIAKVTVPSPRVRSGAGLR